jgi:plasmid maintenance system antidote protein VapI
MKTVRDLPPVHPGEQLREEFMTPLGLSAYRLAKDIAVPVTRVQAIVSERRAITGDNRPAAGSLFRHYGRILAEHAARLRSGGGVGRPRFAP